MLRQRQGLVFLGVMTAAIGGWAVLGEVSVFVQAPGILLGARGRDRGRRLHRRRRAQQCAVRRAGDRVESGAPIAVIVDSEVVELHRTAISLVEENARAGSPPRTHDAAA